MNKLIPLSIAAGIFAFMALEGRRYVIQTSDEQKLHRTELAQARSREDSLQRWYDNALKTDSATTSAYVAWALGASQDSMQKEMDRRIMVARKSVDRRFGRDSVVVSSLATAEADTSCWIRLRCVESGILFASEESGRMDRDSLNGLLAVRASQCTTMVAEHRVAQDSAVEVAESKASKPWEWIIGLILGVFGIGFGTGLAL